MAFALLLGTPPQGEWESSPPSAWQAVGDWVVVVAAVLMMIALFGIPVTAGVWWLT